MNKIAFGKEKLILIIGTILIIVPGIIDFILDHGYKIQSYHQVWELFILLLSAGGASMLWKKYTDFLKIEILSTRQSLKEMEKKTKLWHKENESLIKGLGVAIDRQFEDWNLSNSEKEVGIMLLKGITTKEIAEIRRVKEKTVRQQCQAIYKKSNLPGRNQLSAFFLEDLLLPDNYDKVI